MRFPVRLFFAPLALICGGLLQPPWLPALQGSTPVETHYAAGMEYLQAGQPERAIEEFQQALRFDAHHVPTLLEMADLLSSRDRIFEAFRALQQIPSQTPDSARQRLLLARCLFHIRKFPQAREEFHHSLELDPSLAEPHLALAIIEAEQGRLAEAQEHIRTYLERSRGPSQLQGYELLARISLQIKDYDSALGAYTALLEASPEREDVQMSIARTLLAAQRFAEAEEAYRGGANKHPENRTALRGWFESSYRRGAYPQAIEAMQRLAELDRWSCEPLINQARAYRMLNQFSLARQYAEQCLEIIPAHPAAHYLLGRIAFQEGDLARAKSELEAAVQADPNHADALYWLASVELKLNQTSSALAHLETVVSLDPEHASARYALALQYAQRGRHEEAEEQLAEFNRIKEKEKWKLGLGGDTSILGAPGLGGLTDQGRLDDWMNFAKYLIQENKPQDALQILQEAQRVASDDPEVLRLLGVAYTEMGRIDDALSVYAEAEGRAPTSLLFFGRGQLYFRLGEAEKAQADLRRAVSLGLPPDKAAEARLLLVSLLTKNKRYQEAEAALRRLLELDPQNAPARTLLAWVLLELGRPAEAATQSRQVLQEQPQNPSARLALANALLAEGKTSDAGAEIALAAEMLGENAEVVLARGKLAGARDMGALAVDYFERASQLDPSRTEAFILLGRELAEQSRLEAAIETFRKAIIVDPENGEAYYQLALTLDRSFQVEQAREAARQAKSLGHPKAQALLQSLNNKAD
ncbi:MAG: tetratricopeptide repeat protein [Terriglobia bacterium]